MEQVQETLQQLEGAEAGEAKEVLNRLAGLVARQKTEPQALSNCLEEYFCTRFESHSQLALLRALEICYFLEGKAEPVHRRTMSQVRLVNLAALCLRASQQAKAVAALERVVELAQGG
jgi:hypothetical protein